MGECKSASYIFNSNIQNLIAFIDEKKYHLIREEDTISFKLLNGVKSKLYSLSKNKWLLERFKSKLVIKLEAAVLFLIMMLS